MFGAVLARALDTWWEDAGRPATVDLVEAGAGEGTLARMLLTAEPRCGKALTITLVEAAAVQHPSHPAGVTSRVSMPSAADLHGDELPESLEPTVELALGFPGMPGRPTAELLEQEDAS